MHDARILAYRQMSRATSSIWEEKIVRSKRGEPDPRFEHLARLLCELELNGALRFLLKNNRTRSNAITVATRISTRPSASFYAVVVEYGDDLPQWRKWSQPGVLRVISFAARRTISARKGSSNQSVRSLFREMTTADGAVEITLWRAHCARRDRWFKKLIGHSTRQREHVLGEELPRTKARKLCSICRCTCYPAEARSG